MTFGWGHWTLQTLKFSNCLLRPLLLSQDSLTVLLSDIRHLGKYIINNSIISHTIIPPLSNNVHNNLKKSYSLKAICTMPTAYVPGDRRYIQHLISRAQLNLFRWRFFLGYKSVMKRPRVGHYLLVCCLI